VAASNDAETLLGEIGDAIKYDKFQLLFQPIASLRGVPEEQFQVLLRLRSDNGRIHTAAALIPAAESSGLINNVDRWVLSRCLAVVQERQRQNEARPVRLFVNQSIEGMLDGQRPSWLKQQLDARRVPGEQLVLTFRFADVLARLRQAGSFCQEVRQIGPRIALSGFEASMASYQLLQHVPLDFLVLSPKYVGAEGQSAKMRQELRQLIGYAKERDLRVVAPLVEDAQTAAALWSSGVDFIQGNFVQQATHDLEFDFSASAL
jgi:EAL domain-containing protein (putative c-di-GMP-specific phosphodiesterase class I)